MTILPFCLQNYEGPSSFFLTMPLMTPQPRHWLFTKWTSPPFPLLEVSPLPSPPLQPLLPLLLPLSPPLLLVTLPPHHLLLRVLLHPPLQLFCLMWTLLGISSFVFVVMGSFCCVHWVWVQPMGLTLAPSVSYQILCGCWLLLIRRGKGSLIQRIG